MDPETSKVESELDKGRAFVSDLVQHSVNTVVQDNLRNGLKLKDISDWIKIALLLGSMVAGYVKLSDQVSGHTQQISNVQDQIGEMRKENRSRNINVQRQLGSINMYLCSKDSSHCVSADTAPPPEQ